MLMRPPGHFETAVLLAVTRLGEEAYGVAIREELEKQLGRSVSFGGVYTTLDRLAKKGFVSSFTGDPTPERGGRAKKFFRITPAGSRAVAAARRAWRTLWSLAAGEALR